MLNARELGTVLAALRTWQSLMHPTEPPDSDIATDGGRLVPLSHVEIDALCERINGGGRPPLPLLAEGCLRVCLQQYVEQIATVDVAASNPEEAVKLALEGDPGVTADWGPGDDAETVQVYAVLDRDNQPVWER